MSDKERHYSQVLAQLQQGQLRRVEAAALMGCTPRHVSRLRRVYREQGDAGLVHGLRGQPSHRRCDARRLEQAVALVAAHYRDAGPTYAAERLAADHGLILSHERLRQAMIAAGLWRARPRKAQHRHWRERKPCCGQLVQMDTSQHNWFEGRGEAADLILMIDDATSRAHLRFVPADNSETNRRVLYEYLQRHGRPLALYTDKASHFVVNRPPSVSEQLDGREAETQIGRALRELQIELIVAHSPQAKGRAERFFGTAQDRLVKDLRYAGISTMAAANQYLDEHYLPWWQAHHTLLPASPADAHRDLQGFDLAAILSHQEPRQVQNDYTFSYERQRYQILPDSQLPNLRKHTVTVQQRLDGRVMAWAKGQYLPIVPLPAGGAAAVPAVGLRPPSGAPAPEAQAAPRSPQHPSKARTPAPEHPWRKSYKGTFLSGTKRDISTLR